MKVSAVFLVALFGVGLAAEVQHKRGSEESTSKSQAPSSGGNGASQEAQLKYQQPSFLFQTKAQSYTPPQFNYVVPQTYKYIPQPNLGQFSYVPQQQQQQQQQQHQQSPEAAQQPVQYRPSQNLVYSTQSAIKTVAAPQQKLQYSQEQPQIQHEPQLQQQQQHQHQPVQYSSAADVSSFKFQSPLVTYSNLGVLQQAVGKSAEQQSSRQQYAHQVPQQQQSTPAHPTYTTPQQQLVHQQPQPQFVYKTKLQIPQVTYNPQVQQLSNEKLQLYSQAPQTFQTQKQPQVVYQQVAPKQSASVPQQFVYQVPQQYTYTPVQYVQQEAHTVPQPSYVIAPQYQAIQNYHQQQQ